MVPSLKRYRNALLTVILIGSPETSRSGARRDKGGNRGNFKTEIPYIRLFLLNVQLLSPRDKGRRGGKKAPELAGQRCVLFDFMKDNDRVFFQLQSGHFQALLVFKQGRDYDCQFFEKPIDRILDPPASPLGKGGGASRGDRKFA